jgi:transposase
MRKKEVKEEPLLKGAKYIMLKREENLNDKQRIHFEQIKASNLLTAKAWLMRENFLSIYHCISAEDAESYFERWQKSVIHSNVKPMKQVAKTLMNHKEGIIHSVIDKISNGKAEQHNASIQKLQSVAHGYKNFENLRAAILFFNGHLDILSYA